VWTAEASAHQIWAECYDHVLEDIFAVQEEVTRAIVSEIAPQIEAVEHSKAVRRKPDNLRSVPNNPTSERAMMERSGEGAAPDKRRQLQNVGEGKWRLAKMNCPKADEGSRQHLAVVSIRTWRITTVATWSLRLM
jgi:hypothetical protein